MKTFFKAFAFALAVTLPLSLAVAASGDVLYIKNSATVTLNATQINQLVTFVGQITPDVTAANAVAVTCWKSNGVQCRVQATAQAAPSAYVADSVAGLVVTTSGVVP